MQLMTQGHITGTDIARFQPWNEEEESVHHAMYGL